MKKILIVQAGHIGDLILVQPLAALLKKHFPGCQIIIIGNPYVEPVVTPSPQFDGFASIADTLQQTESDASAILFACKHPALAEWAERVNIPLRISNRHHRSTAAHCNKHVFFSSRYTLRHQAQTFLQLLRGFDLKADYPLSEIIPLIGFHWAQPLSIPALDPERFNLIIHPGTNGSTREWPVEQFVELIKCLPASQFNILLTGSISEAERYQHNLIDLCPEATNLMGQLSLAQLLYFVSQVDGLVANATGPAHIGGAVGIPTLGLYPPRLGHTPRRWGPLGTHTETLMYARKLPLCLSCTKLPLGCACMRKLSVESVVTRILAWDALTRGSERVQRSDLWGSLKDPISQ
jgi:heptosyltransferase-3